MIDGHYSMVPFLQENNQTTKQLNSNPVTEALGSVAKKTKPLSLSL
jgi:hypothetical protein